MRLSVSLTLSLSPSFSLILSVFSLVLHHSEMWHTKNKSGNREAGNACQMHLRVHQAPVQRRHSTQKALKGICHQSLCLIRLAVYSPRKFIVANEVTVAVVLPEVGLIATRTVRYKTEVYDTTDSKRTTHL